MEGFIGIMPREKAAKTDKSPKETAKSVQLPMGLPMLPKKFPKTKRVPPKKTLMATKRATTEMEMRKAAKAWRERVVSEKIMAASIKMREPSNMKPKVPTSKL